MYYKDNLASLRTGLDMVLKAGHWSTNERRAQAQKSIDTFRVAIPGLIRQSVQNSVMINRNLAAAPASHPPTLRPVQNADFNTAFGNFDREVSYALDAQNLSYDQRAMAIQRALTRLGNDSLIPMLQGQIQKSIASNEYTQHAAGALTMLADHQRKQGGF